MDISFQETGVVKQKEDIIIRRGIVHILDATLGYPVYSEQELDLTPDINDEKVLFPRGRRFSGV